MLFRKPVLGSSGTKSSSRDRSSLILRTISLRFGYSLLRRTDEEREQYRVPFFKYRETVWVPAPETVSHASKISCSFSPEAIFMLRTYSFMISSIDWAFFRESLFIFLMNHSLENTPPTVS